MASVKNEESESLIFCTEWIFDDTWFVNEVVITDIVEVNVCIAMDSLKNYLVNHLKI